MAVIKIPSYNIYDIPQSPNANSNKIDAATMSINALKKENGDVLKKQYTVTYYQETEDGSDVTYVGGDSSLNELTFPSPTWVLGLLVTQGFYLTPPKYFISNSVFVPINQGLSYVDGFTIVRRQQWVDLKKQKDNPSRYYTRTVTTSNGLKYNIEDNSFTFYLENTDVTGNGVEFVLIGAEANLGTYGEVNSRLLSETITVEGAYYSFPQTEKSVGDTNGNVFSLPTNELVQDGNTILGQNLSDQLLSLVVGKYQRGKETYTIKCSVADYYDTDGRLAISTTDTNYPCILQKHDIVEPYIFTSSGDEPLGLNANGTPKQFEIIGIDYSYKGVVWQELTLQEYIQ